jgi:hypothetical protein
MEDAFDKKIGHAEGNICCCKPKLACQIISVLIVLEALFKFMGTSARWGAPCFHWWNYVATIITFVTGHALRAIAIPCGVWCLLSIRKGDDKGPQILFHFLCALAAVCALDLFVCVFEVHDVCTGAELREYMSCGHQWGMQSTDCRATDELDSAAVAACDAAALTLSYSEEGGGPFDPQDGSGAAADKAKCEAVSGCEFVQTTEEEWVKPSCCDAPMWEGMSIAPCMRDPHYIAATFDTTSCQKMSDIYDVGFGLVWTLIVIFMAYSVHSYRAQNGGAGLEMMPAD